MRITLLLILLVGAGAQENPGGRTIVFGNNLHPWSAFRQEGTQVKPGPRGDYLGLLDRSNVWDIHSADFHLNFESENVTTGGNYRALDPVVITRRLARMGTGAGVFQNAPGGVRFEAGPASLFTPGNVWHDFQMEFWMYLPTLSDGATVVLWKGAYRQGSSIVPQELRIALRGRVLEMSLVRFFRLPTQGAPERVVVYGETLLLPGKWYHHHFQFHSDRGLLEYTLDGKPEAAVYVTSTRRESGQVFLPLIGELSHPRFVLGEGLNALLDDIRFARGVVDRVAVTSYDIGLGSPKGTAKSPVIDLGHYGYLLETVEVRARVPTPTRVRPEVRVGDYLDGNGGTLGGDWVPWPRPVGTQPLRGRYAQLRLRLEGDGSGTLSPQVDQVALRWNRVPDPPAPQFVALSPDPGWVLSWRPSSDFEVAQYRVFWSLRPGRFDPTRFVAVRQPPGTPATWDRGERPRVRLSLRPEDFAQAGDEEAALAAAQGRVVYLAVAAVKTLGGEGARTVDLVSPFSESVSARWSGQ